MLESSAKTLEFYPECASFFNGSNPDQHAIVRAAMDDNRIDQISAALGTTFGMAIWLGMVLHAAGIEIYVSFEICGASGPSIDYEIAAIDAQGGRSSSKDFSLEANRGRICFPGGNGGSGAENR